MKLTSRVTTVVTLGLHVTQGELGLIRAMISSAATNSLESGWRDFAAEFLAQTERFALYEEV